MKRLTVAVGFAVPCLALVAFSACASAPPAPSVPSPERVAPEKASAPAPGAPPGWHSLFDGATLDGWEVTDFGGQGKVTAENGTLVLGMGEPMTGVTWTRDFPGMDYEIELRAQRTDGTDFFCGLTFPVEKTSASLILGGWGGGVCGISSLDGFDASENETTTYHDFENGKWYRVRLRVSAGKIEAWLDDKQIVDVDTDGKRIDTRVEISPCEPLGLASFVTVASIRDLRWRRVTAGQ